MTGRVRDVMLLTLLHCCFGQGQADKAVELCAGLVEELSREGGDAPAAAMFRLRHGAALFSTPSL